MKLASRSLLESVEKLIAPLERWTEKEQTKAEVEVRYSRPFFRGASDAAFHRRRKTGGREAGLSARLAAERRGHFGAAA